jgi:hypothetical protein
MFPTHHSIFEDPLCKFLEAILLIKTKWSRGHRRINAKKPQAPRTPKKERRAIPPREIVQHRTIQKESLFQISRLSSSIEILNRTVMTLQNLLKAIGVPKEKEG